MTSSTPPASTPGRSPTSSRHVLPTLRPTDPTRVWFSGFGTSATKRHMDEFWSVIAETTPSAIIKNTRPLIFPGRTNFSVVFPDSNQAEMFLELARNNEMSWSDPNGTSQNRITAKPDRPFESRLLGQIYHAIWKTTEEILLNKKPFIQFKLGTTGDRGDFTIRKNDELWTLFSVKNSSTGDDIEIQTNFDAASRWNLAADEISTILSAAMAVTKMD